MGFQLSRIVDGNETLKLLKGKEFYSSIYAHITSIQTIVADDSITTLVGFTFYIDKAERDNNKQPIYVLGYDLDRKKVVENVSDKLTEISLEEARYFVENPTIGDVISLPPNQTSFQRISTSVAISKEVANRGALYSDADVRSYFINQGIAITDVDPD